MPSLLERVTWQSIELGPVQVGMTVAGIIVSGKSTPGLRQQKQIGSSELGQELQRARHEPGVKAVVLRVDSPGAAPLCCHCAGPHLPALATLAV